MADYTIQRADPRWKRFEKLVARMLTTLSPTPESCTTTPFVLIQLHDVIVWDDVRQHSIPSLVLLTVKVTVHSISCGFGRSFPAEFLSSPDQDSDLTATHDRKQ